MRFNSYLTEASRKNLIVCDIQPIYESAFRFKMWEFTDFLNESRGDILYFFNGPDTIGTDDSREVIVDWLIENDLDSSVLDRITWKDKGYAFFRSWMDMGVSDADMIKAIRYMAQKRVYDSRDIELEEWMELFDGEYEDIISVDSIYWPDMEVNELRKWSGSLITGGGKQECLKEVQLLFSAFNIRNKEVKRFIYG